MWGHYRFAKTNGRRQIVNPNCVQAASKFHHNPNRVFKRCSTDTNKVKKGKDTEDFLLECYYRSNGFYKYRGEWKRKKEK